MDTFPLLLLLTIGLSSVLGRPQQEQEQYDYEGDTSSNEDDDYKTPYSFSWAASRYFNGGPDREHKEERGADGITRGVYRYIDPRHKVQEVVYHSDDGGFHVHASNLPKDTVAVAEATNKHHNLYDAITKEHKRIGAELEEKARLAAIEDAKRKEEEGDGETLFYQPILRLPSPSVPKPPSPRQSAAVVAATSRHQQMFDSIVKDYSRIQDEFLQAKLLAEERQRAEEVQTSNNVRSSFISAPAKQNDLRVFTNYLPKASRAVQRETIKHEELFRSVVEQHALIAEELREKARLAELEKKHDYEETGI